MVVHGPGVALVPLSVDQRLHFPLDRLIQDLAVPTPADLDVSLRRERYDTMAVWAVAYVGVGGRRSGGSAATATR